MIRGATDDQQRHAKGQATGPFCAWPNFESSGHEIGEFFVGSGVQMSARMDFGALFLTGENHVEASYSGWQSPHQTASSTLTALSRRLKIPPIVANPLTNLCS